METKNKKARPDERKVPEPGIDDRLSSLPDDILSRILSFLETKYAVGTAVLSRRWKDLWTRVSNLDFDDSLVYEPLSSYLATKKMSPDQFWEYRRESGRRSLEFCDFVDRVLSQHKNLNSLRRFRLHVSSAWSRLWTTNSNLWSKMELASWSLLDEIEVKFNRFDLFVLPPDMRQFTEIFYTSKNLKKLNLENVKLVVTAHGSIFLPSLNTLQLLKVGIKNRESLGRLISGCPVLETARLEELDFSYRNEKYTLIASFPSLKNLTILDGQLCPIVIEAPSLEHLHVRKIEELQFLGSSGSRLPCLVSAEVDIRKKQMYCIESKGVDVTRKKQMSYDCLIRFLTKISNAKEMCFDGDTTDLLSEVNDIQLPVFPNLTHLKMKYCRHSSMLHSLFNAAPKLQSLVMAGMEEWESEPTCIPECLRSSLEELKIEKLLVGEGEMKMAAYLLKFGAALKKVNIHLVDNSLIMRELRALASLLNLPRGSSSCEAHLFLRDNTEIHTEHESLFYVYDHDDDCICHNCNMELNFEGMRPKKTGDEIDTDSDDESEKDDDDESEKDDDDESEKDDDDC